MPRRSGSARTWLLLAALLGIGGTVAWQHRYEFLPPPPPAPLPPKIAFQGAPPDLRAYLVAAKAADKIDDPLARCLAWPDAPGNAWPAGLARAHCEYLFGPRVGFEDMQAMVGRGDIAGLEARLRQDLDRHFDPAQPGEDIHRDFASIGWARADDAMTRRWLELAPDSAFALAARGHFWRNVAGGVRGTGSIGDTPPDAIARMQAAIAEATGPLQRAIAAEPRMMPAYADLIALATLTGDDALEADAVARAWKQDPGCFAVADMRMVALEPQWGGEPQALDVAVRELESQLPRRPLLAVALATPVVAESDLFWSNEQHLESRELLEPAVKASTSAHAHYDFARAISATTPTAQPQAVAMYVAAMRYEAPQGWWASELGEKLVLDFKEFDWAIAILERAVAREPGNGWSRLALADAYWFADRHADAEREYDKLLAAGGPTRGYAMLSRIQHAHLAGHRDQARELEARLYHEFPEIAKHNGIGAPID